MAKIHKEVAEVCEVFCLLISMYPVDLLSVGFHLRCDVFESIPAGPRNRAKGKKHPSLCI